MGICYLSYFHLPDVNECSTENGGCEHTCTDTTGSFVCSCNNGFFLEGKNCTGETLTCYSVNLHVANSNTLSTALYG